MTAPSKSLPCLLLPNELHSDVSCSAARPGVEKINSHGMFVPVVVGDGHHPILMYKDFLLKVG